MKKLFFIFLISLLSIRLDATKYGMTFEAEVQLKTLFSSMQQGGKGHFMVALVDDTIDINYSDEHLQTLVHKALMHEDPYYIEMLLKLRGNDIDLAIIDKSGWTYEDYAAKYNKKEALKFFSKIGKKAETKVKIKKKNKPKISKLFDKAKQRQKKKGGTVQKSESAIPSVIIVRSPPRVDIVRGPVRYQQ